MEMRWTVARAVVSAAAMVVAVAVALAGVAGSLFRPRRGTSRRG
jgi:hypothetical protein